MKKNDLNKSVKETAKKSDKKSEKKAQKALKAQEKAKQPKKASKFSIKKIWEKIKAGFKAFGKGISKVFGSYTPPSWPKDLVKKVKTEPKAKKRFKITMITLGSIAGVVVLFFATLFTVRFIKSKQPVDLSVSCTITAPEIKRNIQDKLVIKLNGSAAPIDMVNKPIVSGITIKPEIKGNWVWDGANKIVFEPIENWKIGTDYKIELDKSVLADHVKLRDKKELSFTTTAFSLEIKDADYVIDDVNPNLKYIEFSIVSNFPMMEQDFASLVEINPVINARNGNVENRTYTAQAFPDTDSDGKRVFFKSEVFGVPAKTIDVSLLVRKGVKCVYDDAVTKDSARQTLVVNGSDTYGRITRIGGNFLLNDEQEYKQIITIETSAKVSISDLNSKLKFYLLPKDRPEEKGTKFVEDYQWYSTDEVSSTVKSKSERLQLKPYETETKYEKVHSYEIDVPENSYIYVSVDEGLEFYGGFYLAKPVHEIVEQVPYPKEVKFISEGNIVSLKGSRRLPIMARGVSDVTVKVWRFKPDDLNHIITQSNGNIEYFSFSDYDFNEENVSEYILEKKLTTNNRKSNSLSYLDFDFSNYIQAVPSKDLRYGLFLLRLENEECNTVKKMVLVTDQTIIVKEGRDDSMDIFVQSVSTGLPLESSRVDILAKNGDIIASTYTDSNGHAFMPNARRRYNGPVAITATYGEDLSFVPYSLNGRYLDYSNFDTGGVYGSQDPNKLSAYIFSDRGLYRPGEKITFGAIVKSGNWSNQLKGTPLLYEIKDPNGTVIAEKEFLLNSSGFEEITYTTKEYSPTGEYYLTLYLKKMRPNGKTYEKIYVGEASAKVEEFMPDTLQITTSFDPLTNDAWIHPGSLSAVVKLKNLFGNNAVGNNVKAEIELDPGYITFNKYKDYKFTDPFVSKQKFSQKFSDVKTDDEGIARFKLDMERFEPASYRLLFNASGFEKESGRSVKSSSVIYVSPLDYLIGVKSDGDLRYIQKESSRNLKFIAVGPSLQTVKVDGIKLSLVEKRYVSVLAKQPNGIYKYQSVKKENTLSEKTISIPKEGLNYALPVDAEGEYALILTDAEGHEYSRTEFSVMGAKNVQRSLSRTAELEVVMNKTDYKPGETAELMIKAPYAGKGLICVERDKVYTYKWFSTQESSSIQTITIPQGLEGNGYVTVMFTRDYDSPEIFMSPFCYSAVPFSVSLDRRTNVINIDVPDVVKPDTDYEIKYSSTKSGKIVIMAVDEGILQLAKHKTPDPLSYFFKKRALEVSTGQTNDLILPEYNILKTLTAMGGGAGFDEFLSQNLNPFRKRQNASVAFWSGIINTDSNVRSVKYHIPSYFNGKLRVMAVAVSDDAVGSAQAYTDVRDTYIIMPNCPNFASPGDEFDVAVTVTNNDAGSGPNAKVKLTAVTDKGLTITGAASTELAISEGKDATYTFTFKTNDVLGNSDIKFTVQGAKNSSRYMSSLSIRPSVPYQVWINSGTVRKSNASVDVNKQLYDEFATREVSLSYLPLGLARGLVLYLDKYPYGCSEQITSAAYPYLYPDLLKDTGKAEKEAKEAIQNAIDVIQARQKDDGTIGYWTNGSQNYPLIDCYCALFLTTAKEKGYYVPSSTFTRLLGALKEYASEGRGFYAAYATYVLTRNEEITTSYLENLSKNSVFADTSLSLTELYMAASYRLLRMDKEAKKYTGKIKKGINFVYDNDMFASRLYIDSAYLYIISSYFPEQLKVIGDTVLGSIEKSMSEGEYNSISSAMTLSAIEAYLKATPNAATGKFVVKEDLGKEKGEKQLSFKGNKLFTGDFDGDAQKLSITSQEDLNLYYQVNQAGFMKNIPESETKDNGLEITRSYSSSPDGKGQTSFTVGDEIYVTIRMRTLNGSTINNVAIVDMLPSCFEIDYDSIRRENKSDWKPDYADIRDDRVIFYGTVTGTLKSYTFKVKVITNGSFVVPPVFAQAMYDNKVKALKPYEKIKVQKAK